MCIRYRVTYVDESAKQFAEFEYALARVAIRLALCVVETPDRVLQAVTSYKPHRIERAPVGQVAKTVNRHNSWMFQAAGDLSFELESRSETRLEGELGLDFLECNVAV